MNKTLISIFFVLLLTACTQTTDTDLPPTSKSQSIEIEFEVTFDGNGCTVSGPTEVLIGDYSFLLNNASGRRVKLVVTHLLDGHTLKDLVDLQY
jgi:hypothetical protein